VQVLAVIHGEKVRAGTFQQVLEERGHELEEWSLAWGTPPPQPLDAYGAVLVFGGAMHADQDDHHPWLRDESFLLQRLLGLGTPVLGVCLGAQLLARASRAAVMPAREPEIGWYPVELTEDAVDDPVFSRLPRRFRAFQWHFYTYDLPAGACELARSPVCNQAFRLGQRAWGIQFHAEVTREEIDDWVEVDSDELLGSGEQLLLETAERLEAWNEIGRELCGGFLETAERANIGGRVSAGPLSR
jgi:GMP synthase-like glutamine amidotransferase